MQAADKIMAAANKQGAKIATADLYSFVLGKCGGAGYKTCDGFQLPMNVHYTGEQTPCKPPFSLGWVLTPFVLCRSGGMDGPRGRDAPNPLDTLRRIMRDTR